VIGGAVRAAAARQRSHDQVRALLTEQLKQGVSRCAVGDQVLTAIGEERFYVPTHPELDPMIEQRM
jgi:hypothetical protein